MQKRARTRKKIMINFEIEPEWNERLNRAAKEEERSKSSLLRYIVKQYVEEKEKNRKKA